MRKKIIAGNWKMNKTVEESARLAADIAAAAKGLADGVDVVIAPTFLALDRAAAALKGSAVKLAAQDVHWEKQGAFTGKVSTDMLKALGAAYVILGHSEQRQYFHETDDTVRRKAAKVLAEGLAPILCVGETLAERDAGRTEAVVETQVRGAYQGLGKAEALRTVIAYEPVWAIGTGRNATDEQAQAAHAFIRALLQKLYDGEVAQSVRIQYGGSMKPENAAGLLKQPDVDGGLIGGASLKVETFLDIIRAAKS